jgi:hypothetical protein
MEGVAAAVLFVWLVVAVLSGLFAAIVATGRGNAASLYFAAGVLLGPIGVLVAALAPRSVENEARRQEMIDAERRRLRGG